MSNHFESAGLGRPFIADSLHDSKDGRTQQDGADTSFYSVDGHTVPLAQSDDGSLYYPVPAKPGYPAPFEEPVVNKMQPDDNNGEVN